MTAKKSDAIVKSNSVPSGRSVLANLANRYNCDSGKLLATLKSTAFKDANDEQMIALCIVADQYKLNPFTKEIYAFPDKGGGIVPVVSIDGWLRIINDHPEFDGMDIDGDEDQCKVTIYRKDRTHACTVTEYASECNRQTAPWKSHPARMLRHKAVIQCARIAFGFSMRDPDEAERIIEAQEVESRPNVMPPRVIDVPSDPDIETDAKAEQDAKGAQGQRDDLPLDD